MQLAGLQQHEWEIRRVNFNVILMQNTRLLTDNGQIYFLKCMTLFFITLQLYSHFFVISVAIELVSSWHKIVTILTHTAHINKCFYCAESHNLYQGKP